MCSVCYTTGWEGGYVQEHTSCMRGTTELRLVVQTECEFVEEVCDLLGDEIATALLVRVMVISASFFKIK